MVKVAIFGIEGGIGTGKTLTLVTLGLQDLVKGRKLYSNVKLKNVKGDITYMTKDFIHSIFESVKARKFDMSNSTTLIQEAHNYMDSRSSMSEKNRALTYWILQSRHTGAGCSDIIYDTQDFGQVDKRLRNNTDYYIHPQIVQWSKIKGRPVPMTIYLFITAKIGHRWQRLTEVIDVTKSRDLYDTHEVVDF